jgi:hypothetical protein
VTRLSLVWLAGCWTNGPSPAAPSTAAPPHHAHVAQPGCGGHAFDFTASGTGLEAYEGRRVWAVALENDPRRTVTLESTIVHGGFALRCPRSLDRNSDYPAAVIVIDADGDGVCSAHDLAITRQYYAWNFDIVVGIAEDAPLVAQAHTVVGDRKTFDFCRRYFP